MRAALAHRRLTAIITVIAIVLILFGVTATLSPLRDTAKENGNRPRTVQELASPRPGASLSASSYVPPTGHEAMGQTRQNDAALLPVLLALEQRSYHEQGQAEKRERIRQQRLRELRRQKREKPSVGTSSLAMPQAGFSSEGFADVGEGEPEQATPHMPSGDPAPFSDAQAGMNAD